MAQFFSVTARAGPAEFLDLLSKQTTPIEKSMVCYRIWHLLAAIREINLAKAVQNKSEDLSRRAHHLYQTQTRVAFIEALSETDENLKKLLLDGYEAGAGMDLREYLERLEPDCIHGVNALLSAPENRGRADQASAEASAFVDEVYEQWNLSE